jgi:hypothetical protein
VFAGRKRLRRIDRNLDRGDELMEAILGELRLTRGAHERHAREAALFRTEFELGREAQDRRQASVDRQLELIRAEFELNRAEFERNRASAEREHELNRREHQRTQAALGNLRDVCRSLVVAVEENTRTLIDLRGEIRAQTEGLLRVLDELRGRGPGGEPAAS